jgi:hypothetical protein
MNRQLYRHCLVGKGSNSMRLQRKVSFLQKMGEAPKKRADSFPRLFIAKRGRCFAGFDVKISTAWPIRTNASDVGQALSTQLLRSTNRCCT